MLLCSCCGIIHCAAVFLLWQKFIVLLCSCCHGIIQCGLVFMRLWYNSLCCGMHHSPVMFLVLFTLCCRWCSWCFFTLLSVVFLLLYASLTCGILAVICNHDPVVVWLMLYTSLYYGVLVVVYIILLCSCCCCMFHCIVHTLLSHLEVCHRKIE